MECRAGAARGRAQSVSIALVAALAGCGSPAERAPAAPAALPGARFVEITRETGLSFDFDRARHDDYFMPDSMAAGCALFDYDGDDDLDVYIVNGYQQDGVWVGPEGADRLLRQEPDGRFTDVTAQAGVGDPGYGMGVAVGDIDNDGDLDLFVTNYGPDTLYRNDGDGTFTDVTVEAGVGDPRWGASAGFFDYDADGFLDLFVSNYLEYDPALRAADTAGRPEYPGPQCCPGAPDSLFRNRGDGTFEDVSASSGIASAGGRGLGVALLDLDRDGRLDIYVANDRGPNFAWIQQPDGTFVDRAPEMGLAVNRYGAAEASMGVAIGDLDGDLTADLFLTNLFQETNTLYLGRPGGDYDDATLGSGLGPPSLDFTGFGTVALDADLDGDLDLLVVNGRVLRSTPRPAARLSEHWRPYGEEGHLYANDGTGHFVSDAGACGPLCAEIQVGRGLAVGDVDDDGDLDALTSSADGRVRLYRNTGAGEAHWIELRVLDRGRDAFGAVVLVEAGGRTLRRDVSPVASYLSSSDPRVQFGLGAVSTIDAIRVVWPGGTTEAFEALPVDRIHRIVRGAGRGVDDHE
jgi:hypothetical protein